MTRPKHSKKEIEDALSYAEDNNWRIEISSGHAWGRIYCPHKDKDCRCGEFCITSSWSTPKNPGNHAQQIRRVIDNCAINKQQKNALKDTEDN